VFIKIKAAEKISGDKRLHIYYG